ncbi:SDR family NAD(P)-dependent oxidoreductase [Thiolapillus sp.]|nr:SDR family NAD(P)-dependent oxidoreductase [Thiolapillus sp.]
MKSEKSALVLGVGPEQGLGAALARRFAAEGLNVFIAGRTVDRLDKVADSIQKAHGKVTPIVADATKEQNVIDLFKVVKSEAEVLSVAACTVDSNIRAPLLDMDLETFTSLWKQNCLAGFLFGREAVKLMEMQQQGTLFFTGATASLRAKPPFTGFAAAKAGLRAIAQGMAREFSPSGIHVVHVIIDGVIEGDRARQQFPDYIAAKGSQGLLQLDAIADTYWAIHRQHPSAWTHELDLRPFQEPF